MNNFCAYFNLVNTLVYFCGIQFEIFWLLQYLSRRCRHSRHKRQPRYTPGPYVLKLFTVIRHARRFVPSKFPDVLYPSKFQRPHPLFGFAWLNGACTDVVQRWKVTGNRNGGPVNREYFKLTMRERYWRNSSTHYNDWLIAFCSMVSSANQRFYIAFGCHLVVSYDRQAVFYPRNLLQQIKTIMPGPTKPTATSLDWSDERHSISIRSLLTWKHNQLWRAATSVRFVTRNGR